jgi:hypothetical protein
MGGVTVALFLLSYSYNNKRRSSSYNLAAVKRASKKGFNVTVHPLSLCVAQCEHKCKLLCGHSTTHNAEGWTRWYATGRDKETSTLEI